MVVFSTASIMVDLPQSVLVIVRTIGTRRRFLQIALAADHSRTADRKSSRSHRQYN
jgi:hypothetical protein